MATNGSTQSEWINGPKLSTQSYSTKGVPIEVMVELSNFNNSEPWFCMPHLATDDYVKNFALYCSVHLYSKPRENSLSYSFESNCWLGQVQ